MDNIIKDRIKDILRNTMQRIINKRTLEEPYCPSETERNNPFGSRLLPIDEIWKASKFERSFVTSLGQKVFEEVARVIAEGTGSTAIRQHTVNIRINTFRKEYIDSILKEERDNSRIPNWNNELNEILVLNNNSYQDLRIKFDLYIKRPDGVEEFYSMKTVKPNLDQVEVAKKDMLYTMAALDNIKTYFALPYNPAGEGNDYRSIHSIPYKIFDMTNDDCVLIGSEFWNTVGQDSNTYNELLNIFYEVGIEFAETIKKDYLMINN